MENQLQHPTPYFRPFVTRFSSSVRCYRLTRPFVFSVCACVLGLWFRCSFPGRFRVCDRAAVDAGAFVEGGVAVSCDAAFFGESRACAGWVFAIVVLRGG